MGALLSYQLCIVVDDVLAADAAVAEMCVTRCVQSAQLNKSITALESPWVVLVTGADEGACSRHMYKVYVRGSANTCGLIP
jgi:hypothetical protein